MKNQLKKTRHPHGQISSLPVQRLTHLNNAAFGDDAERGVEWAGGVFLDAKDRQLERRLQLGMHDVRFVEPQPHRTDEALELRRLARETVTNETNFGHHALPRLLWKRSRKLTSFSRLDSSCQCSKQIVVHGLIVTRPN